MFSSPCRRRKFGVRGLETHSPSRMEGGGVGARPEVEYQSRLFKLNKPRVLAAGQCPTVG